MADTSTLGGECAEPRDSAHTRRQGRAADQERMHRTVGEARLELFVAVCSTDTAEDF